MIWIYLYLILGFGWLFLYIDRHYRTSPYPIRPPEFLLLFCLALIWPIWVAGELWVWLRK